jgi:hypothetical protein
MLCFPGGMFAAGGSGYKDSPSQLASANFLLRITRARLHREIRPPGMVNSGNAGAAKWQGKRIDYRQRVIV